MAVFTRSVRSSGAVFVRYLQTCRKIPLISVYPFTPCNPGAKQISLWSRPTVTRLSQKPDFTERLSNTCQSQEYHSSAIPQRTLVERMKDAVGLRRKMRYSGVVMRRSGLRLYLSCVELIDYEEFFSVLQLPDTFNSWFRITELHIWLAMVRLKSENREGEIVRNNMLKHLWEDVDKRTRKLGSASSSSRAEGVGVLNEEFRASIFAYDEGLLSDDKTLAGTVWRNFFKMNCEDAEKIGLLVGYIRKQMQNIDNQETEQILGKGIITFLPLSSDQESTSRTKQIIEEIRKRT